MKRGEEVCAGWSGGVEERVRGGRGRSAEMKGNVYKAAVQKQCGHTQPKWYQEREGKVRGGAREAD